MSIANFFFYIQHKSYKSINHNKYNNSINNVIITEYNMCKDSGGHSKTSINANSNQNTPQPYT